MAKEIFKSSFEAKQEKLLEQGGIYYFETEDPKTKEKKKFVNIMGIKIETEATENEINEIKKEMLLSELDQMLLRKMAQCYCFRQPLMIEGPPATGKTFLIKYFTKLLHGKDAQPLTIYGNTRTEADDILGHWVPKTEDEETKKIWDKFLESDEGKKAIESLENKLKNKKNLSKKQRQNIFKEGLIELAKSIGLHYLSEFEFQEGPLLKAYSAEEGKGYILAVEEIGVIPTNVQETFLQIGGERGGLANEIQFWGNGREIYYRGPHTWIVFATNPPEEVGARHEVTTPLATRLVWIRIEKERIPPKVDAIIDYEFSKRKPEIKPENLFISVENPIDFSKYPGLADALSLALQSFHNTFSKYYESKGEKDRNQKFEIGTREVLRVIDFMRTFQLLDPKTNQIDLVSSFKAAVELYYLDKLADEDLKKTVRKALNEILEGTASPGYKPYGKSLAEKIKEETEMVVSDIETLRRRVLDNIEKFLEKIYKIPEEYKNWIEIENPVNDYKRTLNEIDQLKKSIINEKNLDKIFENDHQFENKLKPKIEELAQKINEKINEAEKINNEINKFRTKLKI